MPTAAELDRLQALVTRLTPLTETGPGELIRAEDWNRVVGALIEVARVVLAEEREEADPPPHEHPDQVAISWLTPQLRELIERGPLADPAATGRLREVERRLGRLAEVDDRAANELSSLRSSVTEVASRDLAREASVTQIRRVVEGMADARDDVANLRGTLRSLEGSVKVAIDVSNRLTIDGELVDMEAVGARITAVEEMRDRLRLPNGSLLDATAFEKRLLDLQTSLVTEEELDEALTTRAGHIEDEQVGALEERLRVAVGDSLDTKLSTGIEGLRHELDERFAGVDALVATAISDALPGISERVLGTIRPELDAQLAAVREESRATLDDRLGTLDENLRGTIDTRSEELRAFVPQVARAELDQALSARLLPLEARFDGLDSRAGELGRRQTEQQRALTGVVAELQRTSRAQDDGFRAVRDEIAERIAGERQLVEQRLAESDGLFESRVQAVLEEVLGPAVDERVKAAIAEAVGDLDGRMRSIAADAAAEVEARLAERVDGVVNEQVEVARRNLGAQIDAGLSRGLERMPRRVFNEMGDELARLIDRRIDERVGPR